MWASATWLLTLRVKLRLPFVGRCFGDAVDLPARDRRFLRELRKRSLASSASVLPLLRRSDR